MSKFEETYKMIMEGRYSDYREDAGDFFGKARYASDEFNGDNPQMQGIRNGEPVINPITGEPIYWTVTATHYNCFDAVTGKRIVAPHTVLELCYGSGRKNTLYVAMETYLNAYESGDEVAIAKLKSMGLEPGFDFGKLTSF